MKNGEETKVPIDRVKKPRSHLWIKILAPSLIVVVLIAASVIFVSNFLNNQKAFSSEIVFNSYDEFVNYYNSDYCLDNPPGYSKTHDIIDTSSVIEGIREYHISGVDRCKQFHVDCLEKRHYLDVPSEGVYEFCKLSSNYDYRNETSGISTQCFYYLTFMPFDASSITGDFFWEKWDMNNDITFYEHRSNSADENLNYYLKNNGKIVAKFEGHGIPLHDETAKVNDLAFTEAIEKMNIIREQIKTRYETKHEVIQ